MLTVVVPIVMVIVAIVAVTRRCYLQTKGADRVEDGAEGDATPEGAPAT
jgi:hypothetical protein